ncbi:MAG: hypothetical protein AB7I35_08115 [Ramlibacter sp.]
MDIMNTVLCPAIPVPMMPFGGSAQDGAASIKPMDPVNFVAYVGNARIGAWLH